jgi:hypothetical protein
VFHKAVIVKISDEKQTPRFQNLLSAVYHMLEIALFNEKNFVKPMVMKRKPFGAVSNISDFV